MTDVRVAIVGTGFIARTHAGAWSATKGATLVGILSRSGSSIGDLPSYAELGRLVAEQRPDILVVCTPTHLHAATVVEALRAGIDVLCEKPLALTSETANSLFEEAAISGRHLWVAHVLRSFPQYRALGASIREGKLGDVGVVRLRRAVPHPGGWFADEERSGGVAMDLLIHDVDFVVSLFGVPSRVIAQETVTDSLAVHSATLTFDDGTIALLEGQWGGVGELEFAAEAAGSLGMSSFSSIPSAPLRISGAAPSGVEAPLLDDPFHAQAAAILARRADEPTVDQSAIDAVTTCRMMIAAAREHRAIEREVT